MPRSRKSPSGAQSARRKDGAAQQHRPTALHEDPPPYTVPHSEFRAPRFIDLFCGIGGFRLAFERAGAKCVFSSDWDKVSQQPKMRSQFRVASKNIAAFYETVETVAV